MYLAGKRDSILINNFLKIYRKVILMKKKANIFLSIALIIALLVLIYCVYEIVSLQDELTFAREKNKIMAQQLQSLSMESKNYREEINNFPGLNDFDIRRLKQQGIEDPEETIINTLYQSPNLIPVDGTLGGTMRFYRPRIWVLSKKSKNSLSLRKSSFRYCLSRWRISVYIKISSSLKSIEIRKNSLSTLINCSCGSKLGSVHLLRRL